MAKARHARLEKAKATDGIAAAAKPDYNTVRRERRAAERAAKVAQKGGNGHSNGNGEGVSAEALWAHARRLSRREPWRAITREFGGSDADAREALRAMALPFGVATAALERFLALPITSATSNRE